MSGEFVARMADVLDLYHQEYNPERPVVCFDETSRQLTGEVASAHQGRSRTGGTR